MKHTSLFAGALLTTTPLALLISGCGGGNGGGFLGGNPTATPVVTATATGTPLATATTVPTGAQTSNFTLGNGQRAILTTVVGANNTLSGTIQILAPALISRSTKALTTSIKIGTFQITGTFSPPRGFQFTVTDGGQTLFSMSGQLATATQTGSYTLNFNGQTDSGIIPTLGTPFPTATPRPTTSATPMPTPTASGALSGTYNFSVQNGAGSNFGFTSIEGSGTNDATKSFYVDGVGNISGGTGISANFLFLATGPNTNFTSTTQTRNVRILINKQGGLKVGDVIPANINASQTSDLDMNVTRYFPKVGAAPGTLQTANWDSYSDSLDATQNGTVTVTAVTPKTITVTLKNVLLAPNSTNTASDKPQGTLTINGTYTVNNYRQG